MNLQDFEPISNFIVKMFFLVATVMILAVAGLATYWNHVL